MAWPAHTDLVIRRFEPWRTEADDDWLAEHSSDTFARIRRIASFGTASATAIADSAAAGFLLSPPRNPNLRVRDVTAEQVRYAESQYAYTTILIVDNELCPRCGCLYAQVRKLELRAADGHRTRVGEARKCRRCDRESWMFRSWMPHAVAREAMHSRAVL